MNAFFKAPLFWFLLLGFSLFLLDRWHERAEEQKIVITSGDIQRIRDQWQSQSGRPVSEDMLQALISEQVQERRLYREALAQGLDQGDVIIRRRLAQKLRFLTEDLAESTQTPTATELRAYFDTHSEDYQHPARLTFQQIFFSAEDAENPVGADKGLQGRTERPEQALRLLDESPPGDTQWQQMGDPFMLGHRFSEYTPQVLAQQFGEDFMSQLREALNTLETDRWFGPIHSVYGQHLIRVQHYQPPHAADLEEVNDRVMNDYRVTLRKRAFEQYLARLAEKYPAFIDTPDAIKATQNATQKAPQNATRPADRIGSGNLASRQP